MLRANLRHLVSSTHFQSAKIRGRRFIYNMFNIWLYYIIVFPLLSGIILSFWSFYNNFSISDALGNFVIGILFNSAYLVFLLPIMCASILLYEKCLKNRIQYLWIFLPPIFLTLLIKNAGAQFAGVESSYWGYSNENLKHFIPLLVTYILFIIIEIKIHQQHSVRWLNSCQPIII